MLELIRFLNVSCRIATKKAPTVIVGACVYLINYNTPTTPSLPSGVYDVHDDVVVVFSFLVANIDDFFKSNYPSNFLLTASQLITLKNALI